MRSLDAISLDPFLRRIPPADILIIGSITLALYKTLANVDKDDHYLPVNDLDLSVPTAIADTLYESAYAKRDAPVGVLLEDPWILNNYHGTRTVRRSHWVSGLPKRPVQLDVGSGVHTWSHEEATEDSLPYTHGDRTYAVLNPLKQLMWYEGLNRKKDALKIENLRTFIIPRLADVLGSAFVIPPECEILAKDVISQ